MYTPAQTQQQHKYNRGCEGEGGSGGRCALDTARRRSPQCPRAATHPKSQRAAYQRRRDHLPTHSPPWERRLCQHCHTSASTARGGGTAQKAAHTILSAEATAHATLTTHTVVVTSPQRCSRVCPDRLARSYAKILHTIHHATPATCPRRANTTTTNTATTHTPLPERDTTSNDKTHAAQHGDPHQPQAPTTNRYIHASEAGSDAAAMAAVITLVARSQQPDGQVKWKKKIYEGPPPYPNDDERQVVGVQAPEVSFRHRVAHVGTVHMRVVGDDRGRRQAQQRANDQGCPHCSNLQRCRRWCDKVVAAPRAPAPYGFTLYGVLSAVCFRRPLLACRVAQTP